MTEDQAREKWCPFHGTKHSAPEGSCIASECMAWRWKVDESGRQRLANDSGYCGLAGKP